MKRFLVVLLVLTMVLAIAAIAKEASGGATSGWVVDAKCGVKGANAAGEACTKKCLAAGEKMAFVPDGTQDVLIVDNPEALKGHEGHHVSVTGKSDKAAKTIHVDGVKMMAENK